MDHLYYDQTGKSSKCDCNINMDHRIKLPADINTNVDYYVRDNMFEAWKPVYKKNSIGVYPVWLKEDEKDQIIAHWEKTGMFGSVVQKIRAAEMTKGIQ